MSEKFLRVLAKLYGGEAGANLQHCNSMASAKPGVNTVLLSIDHPASLFIDPGSLSPTPYLLFRRIYFGVFCKSGRSSGTIAPSTGQTCKQIPQSIQVEKSIQYQSVPFVFLLGPG
jgi:hypothetical protein